MALSHLNKLVIGEDLYLEVTTKEKRGRRRLLALQLSPLGIISRPISEQVTLSSECQGLKK